MLREQALIMSTEITFDALLRHGRRITRMTPAEFDYAVSWDKTANPDLWRTAAIGAVLEVQPEAGEGSAVDLVALAEEVLTTHRDAIAQHVATAQGRTYTGWSTAAQARGQRIAYYPS